jgi:hypothetical protein
MQNGPSKEQAIRFRKLFGQMARHETDLTQIKRILSTEEYGLFVPYAQNLKRTLQTEQQKSKLKKEISTLQQQVVDQDKVHGQNMNRHQQTKETALNDYSKTIAGRIKIN